MKIFKPTIFLFLVFFILKLSSCKKDDKKLVIAALNNGTLNFQVGDLILKEFKNDIRTDFRFDSTAFGSLINVKLVEKNEADYAIVQYRINVHYQKAIDLDLKNKNSNSIEKPLGLIAIILNIRESFFINLLDKKLIADESVNTFFRIQEHSQKRIYRKLEELKGR